MGHKDVKTTMIYKRVLNRGPLGVRSPADLMWHHEPVVGGPANHGYCCGSIT
jgi:hypothetical protein